MRNPNPQLESWFLSSAEQCREMDRLAMDECGYPGLQLMETAGLQAARETSRRFGPGRRGGFFVGRGNNGGDALVMARYLVLHEGHQVDVWFPSGRDGLTPDTATNLAWLQDIQSETSRVTIRDGLPGVEGQSVDYWVDGLIGTGLEANVRGEVAQAIDLLTEVDRPVISLDIPSGLHADRGVVMGCAVRATLTLTFGARKTGLYLEQGPARSGEIHFVPLSFHPGRRPHEAVLIHPDQLMQWGGAGRTATWKYEDDTVWVIGGSEGLTGATVTAVKAAWRAGVGSVHLLTPRGLMDVYDHLLPEAICVPIGERAERSWGSEHCDDVIETLKRRRGVLLMGPGLGTSKPILRFAGELLDRWSGRAVLDADALRIPELRERMRESDRIVGILTPHPGEFRAYAGRSVGEGRDRLMLARELADEGGSWIVAKGEPTVVGVPGEQPLIAGYSSRLFARAGFGDLLSGTLAGEWAKEHEGKTADVISGTLLELERRARRFYLREGRYPAPGDLL